MIAHMRLFLSCPVYTQYKNRILLILTCTVTPYRCWSFVYIFILWSNKIAQNSFKVSTIVINSFSVTVYHDCGHVTLRIYKAIGFPYWLINISNWKSLAFVWISESSLKSIYMNKVSRATIRLILSNAFCLESVDLNVTLVEINAVKGCSRCYHLAHIFL